MKNIRDLLIKQNLGQFIVFIITAILEILAELSFAFAFKVIFDLATGSTVYSVKEVAAIIILSLLFKILATYFIEVQTERLSIKAMEDFKLNMMSSYLTKDNEMNTSNILNVVTDLSEQISEMYIKPFLTIVRMIIMFIGAAFAIFMNQKAVLLIVFLVGWIPLIYSKLSSSKTQKSRGEYIQTNEQFISKSKEIVDGYDLIKSFKIENRILNIFKNLNIKNENARYAADKDRSFYSSVSISISSIVYVASQLAAFSFVIFKVISVGQFMMVIQLSNFVQQPLSVIPEMYSVMKSIEDQVSSKLKLINETNKDTRNSKFDFDDKISVNNLEYSYGDNLVLSDISFDLEKGKKYAIIGESGSGKSTLAKILLGRLEDYKGSIKIGQDELKDINRKSLYSSIVPVNQEVFMFNDTIKENICLYNEFSDDRVEYAIQKSELSKLIDSLPNKLNTIYGENMRDFSGGEKQRISIARCLIRDCDMIILDEATSVLDFKNSRLIENTILSLKQTALVITHKLDEKILKKYDEVFVLVGGKIVERGKYEDLTYFK